MSGNLNTGECDLEAWVESAPTGQEDFREAAKTILTAITSNLDLRKTMVIKGGVLMAIRYGSDRHTTDIDFSSSLKRGDINIADFKHRFETSLATAVVQSGSDLDCRVQRCKFNPKDDDATFPSIDMTVGYARKGTKMHGRLMKRESVHAISIDFSLNEEIFGFEDLEIGSTTKLQAYTFTDIVAEKLRSLLQQPSRDRYRRQDPYDLRFLIELGIDEGQKQAILDSLMAKSLSRGIEPDRDSISDPEVRRRAEQEYHTLASEIEGELPDFDESFDLVEKFYKSLPW